MTLFLRPALGLLSLTLMLGGTHAARCQEFASSVSSYSDLNPNSLYSNPSAALGQPTTLADDGFGDLYHDSLAYSAYGTDTQKNNLLALLGTDGLGSLTVKFDQSPVTHSDSHWFGDDFIVYSNQFFDGAGSSYVDVNTDMAQYNIGDGTVTGTLPTVSVSADGINFVTLKPADSVFFPENPYKWVGISKQNPSGWDDSSLQDFSKPVDPSLAASSFAGQSVAYAANTLYNGSAGGTAFSLAGTPFAATGIQYIRFTGEGAIDGVSRVSDNPAAVPEASTYVSLGLLLTLGVFAVRRSRTLTSR